MQWGDEYQNTTAAHLETWNRWTGASFVWVRSEQVTYKDKWTTDVIPSPKEGIFLPLHLINSTLYFDMSSHSEW